MANAGIRELIKEKGLKHYEVAKRLNISRWTFSVWLSEELPEVKKQEILKVLTDEAV